MMPLLMHTKDFIQILKLAKKKSFLEGIFFICFLPPPNSITPKRSDAAPPGITRRSYVLSHLLPTMSFALPMIGCGGFKQGQKRKKKAMPASLSHRVV
jgi:hypothetical protein